MRARTMLLFLRLFFAAPSIYHWTDAQGQVHEVHQGDGGEQGDPLMPALP